jgi:transcriptional regulator with XRE-family HTH domain
MESQPIRYATIVGQFVREARTREKLSQEALAEASGVVQSTISAIERADEGRTVSAAHVEALLSALRMDAVTMIVDLNRIVTKILHDQTRGTPGTAISAGRTRIGLPGSSRATAGQKKALPSPETHQHRRLKPR